MSIANPTLGYRAGRIMRLSSLALATALWLPIGPARGADEAPSAAEHGEAGHGPLNVYASNAGDLATALHNADKVDDALMSKVLALIDLGENIVQNARSQMPHCAEYLDAALRLRPQLDEISSAQMERDYHHDGALPKAPGECYHIKDLLVHAASVHVLLREDRQRNARLSEATKTAAQSELAEVLAHLSAHMGNIEQPVEQPSGTPD